MLSDKKFRSILCLNGELPASSFFASDLPVIAVDGAINQLVSINVRPALIIGDLDSAEAAHLASFPYRHIPDQATSDFEKALGYLQENKLLPAMVVGINGGCIDHVLHNINLFTESDSVFYAPPLIGFVMSAGQSRDLLLPLNTKISLMGLSSATVTTAGLKWNLTDENLNFPGKSSCFNRTEAPQINLTVHAGKLLVMYYEHPVDDAGATS